MFLLLEVQGAPPPELLAPPEEFEDNWHKKEYGEYGY